MWREPVLLSEALMLGGRESWSATSITAVRGIYDTSKLLFVCSNGGAHTPFIAVQPIPPSRMNSILSTTSLGGALAMMCFKTATIDFGVPIVIVVAVTIASHGDRLSPLAVASRSILSTAFWVLVGGRTACEGH